MAKKVNIIGAQPKRVHIVDKPQRHIEPAELAAALGAVPNGKHVGNLDHISLAELGTALIRRLRSSGGRPALADATEFCRVPLSANDMKALEKITGQIEQATGSKPSPGQVASVIVRDYLAAAGHAQAPAAPAALESKPNDPLASLAAWKPRLAEIASEASELKKRASAIEAAISEIKGDIDSHVKGA